MSMSRMVVVHPRRMRGGRSQAGIVRRSIGKVSLVVGGTPETTVMAMAAREVVVVGMVVTVVTVEGEA
jgi:hypothetical protein